MKHYSKQRIGETKIKKRKPLAFMDETAFCNLDFVQKKACMTPGTE